MSDSKNNSFLVSVIGSTVTMLLIAGCIGFGPIVGIWALNTLFPLLAIPYTLTSWAAFMALAVILHLICTA
jgi:hypothetical protein